MCWWSLLRTLQSVKVCVCVCVWCVFSLCVCVVCVFVRVCMVCVCVFACVLVCVYVCSYAHTCICVWCGWVCVHTCIHVCLCVVGVGVGVSTYMHACVCRESREPLFLPCSFSSVGGSGGIWLITQHYCTFFARVQFLTVKEVFKGEVQPLDQLPHCHNVNGIVGVCMHVVCV